MQGRNTITFRISDPLKYKFQGACRQLHTKLTMELSRMIHGFVQQHSVRKQKKIRPLKSFSSYEWSGR